MCIVANTLVMCINFYGRSEELDLLLAQIGMLFNIVYTCEFIVKFIGMGKDYFHDNWNNFDFAIVLSAWLGELAERADLPIGDILTLIRNISNKITIPSYFTMDKMIGITVSVILIRQRNNIRCKGETR